MTELKGNVVFFPHHLVATGDLLSPNAEKLLGLQVLCVQSMLPFGVAEGGIPASPNNK